MYMDLGLNDGSETKNNNTLSIRLTESAVFLTTDGRRSQSRARDTTEEQRSTLLRGLLILQLVKPTRITSIDVELTATSSISWPEGIGARRIDVTEEHRVFHASTVYFRAIKSHSRRSASIGPGISYNSLDQDDDWDVIASSYRNETPTTSSATQSNTNNERSIPPQSVPSTSTPPSSFYRRGIRRLSVDSSHSRHDPDGSYVRRNLQQLPPIPPYTPVALPMTSYVPNFPTAQGVNGNHPLPPVKSFEDPGRSPYASLRGGATSTRHEDAIPEDDTLESERDFNFRANLPSLHLLPTAPSSPALPSPPSSPTYLSRVVDSHSPTSPLTPRGRKRFSLSAVSNVIIDAVRSTSPRPGTNRFGQSREREHSRNRERSVDTPTSRVGRGRTMERSGEESVDLNGDFERDSKHVKERGRGIIAVMLGDKEKGDAEGWKEFKKGTYTFPISLSIPGDAPPTMVCDYGSVHWELKANVHRPGTFSSKMTATREVITVACPRQEDTEDIENIIVERHWDQQMQYLISVSGKSFYIGGIVPVTFTLLPLTKVNVYRLSVILEERVDYYTNMRRITRTDPIERFTLLSIKGDDHSPILPLQSNDPDALRHSPLFVFVDPRDDLSEVASNLMGPGPWTLHQDLKLPGSCSQMKFSNKNRQSNITVTHTLKLVMRVERGDDLFMDTKTGKRKLFDIVVQTPVFIHSCRCNPEWTCLPQYSEVLDGSTSFIPSCPCRARSYRYPNRHTNSSSTMETSSDSGASVAETSSVNLTTTSTIASLRQLRYDEAIMRSSSLFERLVSGQESVSGEVPPAYDVVGSRSTTNGVAML